MTGDSSTGVSKAARAKGKVKKSWISVTSKLKRALHIKQPTEAPVEVTSSLQGENPAAHLAAPEDNDNRTCTSLSIFSGLHKFGDGHISPSSPKGANLHNQVTEVNYPGSAPRRQETGPNDSVRSDAAVSGSVGSDAGNTQEAREQKPLPDLPSRIVHAPVQNVIARDYQCPPAIRIEIPNPIPESTVAHPKETPARTPGIPLLNAFFTPHRPTILLDAQNAPKKATVKPASPSSAMVISPIGASPTPKRNVPTTMLDTPEMPPSPLKRRGRIPEVFDSPTTIPDNQSSVLSPRSPRRPPSPSVDPPLPENEEKKDFGVIGDRRVVKNRPRSQLVGNGSRNQENTAPVPSVASRPIYVGRQGQQKYYVGKFLGGGGMGKVYSALKWQDMTYVALKVVKRKKFGDPSWFKDELTTMRAIAETRFFHSRSERGLRFANFLIESWYDKDRVYLVMPLCVGTLTDQLQRIRLDRLTVRVYAAQLMCGLEALHDLKIMHCDLKPDNILIHPTGHLVITDFGLSISWLDARYRGDPPRSFRGRRIAGTDGYMAPELASAFSDPNKPRRANFGFAADIWSLGVVIAELGMGGRRLVSFENEEEKKHWRGDFSRFSLNMVSSREMLMKRVRKNLRGHHKMLVERMVDVNEASRATFDEMASHPFFSELDMNRVLINDYKGPTPPLEEVLPCKHEPVEKAWFSMHSRTGGGGEPLSEDSEQSQFVMQDLDRVVIPEDFVWEINEARQKLVQEYEASNNPARRSGKAVDYKPPSRNSSYYPSSPSMSLPGRVSVAAP